MVDLVEWLRAQLDEDERIARAATPGPWWVDSTIHTEAINAGGGATVIGGGRWGGEASVFESDEDAAYIAAWDPARVLREIDSKRRVIELWKEADREAASGQRYAESYETGPDGFPAGREAALDDVLRLLAAPYSDRDGYRKEWAP